MRSSPLASIGLSMLPASMAPSPAPAPTTVCSSSMKVTTSPSLSRISLSTALSRSSNSPRYLAPATIAPRSRAIKRLFFKDSGTSPAMMRWARPSTTAVLPTPGSPMRTGLFFVRRLSTWTTRRISWSRPITGSSRPALAASVRSTPYLVRALYVASGSAEVTLALPRTCSKAPSSLSGVAPASLSNVATPAARTPSLASPTSRCSVETYSSPRVLAVSQAAFVTASASRDRSGAATVEPVALGSLSSSCWVAACRAGTSTPAAWSRGTAIPSC